MGFRLGWETLGRNRTGGWALGEGPTILAEEARCVRALRGVEGWATRGQHSEGSWGSQRTQFPAPQASVRSGPGVRLSPATVASHGDLQPLHRSGWARAHNMTEPPLPSRGLPHSKPGSKVYAVSTLSPERPPGLCRPPRHGFPHSGCRGWQSDPFHSSSVHSSVLPLLLEPAFKSQLSRPPGVQTPRASVSSSVNWRR